MPDPPRYPIRTERLLLRPYRRSDLDALVDVRSREEVVRYLEWGVRTPRRRPAGGRAQASS